MAHGIHMLITTFSKISANIQDHIGILRSQLEHSKLPDWNVPTVSTRTCSTIRTGELVALVSNNNYLPSPKQIAKNRANDDNEILQNQMNVVMPICNKDEDYSVFF
jgi:hypothetical protein